MTVGLLRFPPVHVTTMGQVEPSLDLICQVYWVKLTEQFLFQENLKPQKKKRKRRIKLTAVLVWVHAQNW